MESLIVLADHREHLTIRDSYGNMHVVPVSTIQGYIDGDIPIEDTPDMKDVLRAIMKEWLLIITGKE